MASCHFCNLSQRIFVSIFEYENQITNHDVDSDRRPPTFAGDLWSEPKQRRIAPRPLAAAPGQSVTRRAREIESGTAKSHAGPKRPGRSRKNETSPERIHYLDEGSNGQS